MILGALAGMAGHGGCRPDKAVDGTRVPPTFRGLRKIVKYRLVRRPRIYSDNR